MTFPISAPKYLTWSCVDRPRELKYPHSSGRNYPLRTSTDLPRFSLILTPCRTDAWRPELPVDSLHTSAEDDTEVVHVHKGVCPHELIKQKQDE